MIWVCPISGALNVAIYMKPRYLLIWRSNPTHSQWDGVIEALSLRQSKVAGIEGYIKAVPLKTHCEMMLVFRKRQGYSEEDRMRKATSGKYSEPIVKPAFTWNSKNLVVPLYVANARMNTRLFSVESMSQKTTDNRHYVWHDKCATKLIYSQCAPKINWGTIHQNLPMDNRTTMYYLVTTKTILVLMVPVPEVWKQAILGYVYAQLFEMFERLSFYIVGILVCINQFLNCVMMYN